MRTIFLIFFSTILCTDSIKHVKNITSLLTTTDIETFSDEQLLISTTGGFYKFDINNSTFVDFTSELEFVNITNIEINNSNIWLLGKESNIQILNEDCRLLNIISYDAFNEISKILFYNDYIFAIVSDENGDYLAQLDNNSSATYLNKYNSFIVNENYETISNLNDIFIEDDTIYLATDIGVIKADLINYNNNNLSITLDWILASQYETLFINQNNSGDLVYIEFLNNQLCNSSTNACLNYDSSDLISSIYFNNDNYLLFNGKVYKGNLEEYSVFFELPDNIRSNFLNMLVYDNIFYFALEHHGVIHFNPLSDLHDYIIPETIISNNVESVDVNEDGSLVALVKGGSGGFILDDVLFDMSIKNFNAKSENYFDFDNDLFYESYLLAYPEFLPSGSIAYYGKTLSYISGNESGNVKFDKKGNIYLSNSGIYLGANDFHVNVYSPYKDYIDYLSGLLYIDSNNLDILNGWDVEFSGIMDIYPPADAHNYTTINHMFFDSEENLFIVNPYSERKTPIIIKNDNSEFISINDNTQDWYLLPQESVLDSNGNLWIAYQKDDDPNLSPGGIRMVQLNDVNDSLDDIWYNDPIEIVEGGDCYSGINASNINISLEDSQGNPISVWSLDIGTDIYDHNLLWTVSDYGVMAYVITNYNYSQHFGYLQSIEMTPIRCDFYFSDLSFNKNSKVKIDNQNNAWIINEQGIRIIKSNGEIFSDEYILNSLNGYLLSNIVNDIAFDDEGYVYIATDQGISIFQSTYSMDKNINQISISPNPFLIGKDIGLTITNLPALSTIHIMNLSGRVLKKFDLQDNNVILNWDGKADNGQFLSTGIYLIAGMDKTNNFGVTKMAVIRK